MAYDTHLADRVRQYLSNVPGIQFEEKKMFGGMAFMVHDKMCVNVSGDNLMCRFDPALTKELSQKTGFLPMVMRGREYQGYCYVEPIGFEVEKDFEFWVNLCLDYNPQAKVSKKK